VLYNRTKWACRTCGFHNHAEKLSDATDVAVSSIELYEDRYYCRGISVTYICDGWRSEVKSHI